MCCQPELFAWRFARAGEARQLFSAANEELLRKGAAGGKIVSAGDAHRWQLCTASRATTDTGTMQDFPKKTSPCRQAGPDSQGEKGAQQGKKACRETCFSFLLLLKPLIELEDWFMGRRNREKPLLILIIFAFCRDFQHPLAIQVYVDVFLTLGLSSPKLYW